MGNYHKPTKAKAVPIEVRLAEKRVMLRNALLDNRLSISEKAMKCQELLDSYLDLLRLEEATRKLQ